MPAAVAMSAAMAPAGALAVAAESTPRPRWAPEPRAAPAAAAAAAAAAPALTPTGPASSAAPRLAPALLGALAARWAGQSRAARKRPRVVARRAKAWSDISRMLGSQEVGERGEDVDFTAPPPGGAAAADAAWFATGNKGKSVRRPPAGIWRALCSVRPKAESPFRELSPTHARAALDALRSGAAQGAAEAQPAQTLREELGDDALFDDLRAQARELRGVVAAAPPDEVLEERVWGFLAGFWASMTAHGPSRQRTYELSVLLGGLLAQVPDEALRAAFKMSLVQMAKPDQAPLVGGTGAKAAGAPAEACVAAELERLAGELEDGGLPEDEVEERLQRLLQLLAGPSARQLARGWRLPPPAPALAARCLAAAAGARLSLLEEPKGFGVLCRTLSRLGPEDVAAAGLWGVLSGASFRVRVALFEALAGAPARPPLEAPAGGGGAGAAGSPVATAQEQFAPLDSWSRFGASAGDVLSACLEYAAAGGASLLEQEKPYSIDIKLPRVPRTKRAWARKSTKYRDTPWWGTVINQGETLRFAKQGHELRRKPWLVPEPQTGPACPAPAEDPATTLAADLSRVERLVGLLAIAGALEELEPWQAQQLLGGLGSRLGAAATQVSNCLLRAARKNPQEYGVAQLFPLARALPTEVRGEHCPAIVHALLARWEALRPEALAVALLPLADELTDAPEALTSALAEAVAASQSGLLGRVPRGRLGAVVEAWSRSALLPAPLRAMLARGLEQQLLTLTVGQMIAASKLLLEDWSSGPPGGRPPLVAWWRAWVDNALADKVARWTRASDALREVGAWAARASSAPSLASGGAGAEARLAREVRAEALILPICEGAVSARQATGAQPPLELLMELLELRELTLAPASELGGRLVEAVEVRVDTLLAQGTPALPLGVALRVAKGLTPAGCKPGSLRWHGAVAAIVVGLKTKRDLEFFVASRPPKLLWDAVAARVQGDWRGLELRFRQRG
ncbi:unnamed protein product [Prorocentrum cordatum]|uniref:RAP domain-containing protein n=1 Tax=Prorocentrum cordatum TaxID=2364126 RepID=A0ABN9PCR4_9DINO|nr:unnamed protein product [Polarella glacialis]